MKIFLIKKKSKIFLHNKNCRWWIDKTLMNYNLKIKKYKLNSKRLNKIVKKIKLHRISNIKMWIYKNKVSQIWIHQIY